MVFMKLQRMTIFFYIYTRSVLLNRRGEESQIAERWGREQFALISSDMDNIDILLDYIRSAFTTI